MASLVSITTGNLTSAGTWGLVDTTSELDSEAGNQQIGTSSTDTSSFTPGAITVDGVLVKMYQRASSPSGTLTVTLRNSSSSVDVVSVTVNVSDLPLSSNGNGGWVHLKFAAPETLLAATNYVIRAITSASNQVWFYRNATGGNFCRKLVTTTTQAPAADDHLVICGQLTGAGALTSVTVTMDSVSSTSYGPTVSGGPPQGIVVSLGGTLEWGNAASTAYYLRFKGVLQVSPGGVVNVGTSVSPLGSTTTAIIETACVANVDSGIRVSGGTFGVYRTGNTNMWSLLTSDVSAGATVLPVVDTTGWQAGDIVAIAATNRTHTECEERIIASVDSLTQITVTVALTYAHGGDATSGVQAEVLNLSQGVIFRGLSTSLCGYFFGHAGAVIDVSNAEFTFWGGAGDSKRGIELNGSCASASFRYMSIHDSTGNSQCGFNIPSENASSASWLTVEHVVVYNQQENHFRANVNSGVLGASAVLNDLVFVRNSNYAIVTIKDSNGCTFSNMRIAGSTGNNAGWGIACDSPTWVVFDSLVIHSCNTKGINLYGTIHRVSIIGTSKIWRNNDSGVYVENELGSSTVKPTYPALELVGVTLFGNNGAGLILLRGVNPFNYVLVDNCDFDGGVTHVQSTGIVRGGIGSGHTAPDGLFIHNSRFGIGSAMSGVTLDAGNINEPTQIVCDKCEFSSEPRADQTEYGGYIKIQHYNTAGDHRTYYWQGKSQTDAVIYRTAAPSQRLTPNSNSSSVYKLESGDKVVPVPSGQAATVTVYVRTSVSGDGAAYVGTAPRLMLRRNDAAGVTALTVVATLSGGSGAFAALTGSSPAVDEDSVLEFYIDCDGTAGWVNIDDWSVSVS